MIYNYKISYLKSIRNKFLKFLVKSNLGKKHFKWNLRVYYDWHKDVIYFIVVLDFYFDKRFKNCGFIQIQSIILKNNIWVTKSFTEEEIRREGLWNSYKKDVIDLMVKGFCKSIKIQKVKR